MCGFSSDWWMFLRVFWHTPLVLASIQPIIYPEISTNIYLLVANGIYLGETYAVPCHLMHWQINVFPIPSSNIDVWPTRCIFLEHRKFLNQLHTSTYFGRKRQFPHTVLLIWRTSCIYVYLVYETNTYTYVCVLPAFRVYAKSSVQSIILMHIVLRAGTSIFFFENVHVLNSKWVSIFNWYYRPLVVHVFIRYTSVQSNQNISRPSQTQRR